MNQEEKNELFTLRWHLNQFTLESKEACLKILSRLLGEGSTPSPAPSQGESPGEPGKGLLTVPFAHSFPKRARTRGKYKKGYPVGAVVHFTAGHPDQSIKDAMEFQVKNGYTYFFIDKDGNIAQNFSLDEFGNHAGESKWDGLAGNVSDDLVGIEIACPGKLDSHLKAWFGVHYDTSVSRRVPGLENMEEGNYYKYTKAQEDALVKLLLWLKSNKPDVFNLDLVLGHDEVSGPTGLGWRRKNDPGGSLYMTMPKFRDHLKSIYQPA